MKRTLILFLVAALFQLGTTTRSEAALPYAASYALQLVIGWAAGKAIDHSIDFIISAVEDGRNALEGDLRDAGGDLYNSNRLKNLARKFANMEKRLKAYKWNSRKNYRDIERLKNEIRRLSRFQDSLLDDLESLRSLAQKNRRAIQSNTRGIHSNTQRLSKVEGNDKRQDRRIKTLEDTAPYHKREGFASIAAISANIPEEEGLDHQGGIDANGLFPLSPRAGVYLGYLEFDSSPKDNSSLDLERSALYLGVSYELFRSQNYVNVSSTLAVAKIDAKAIDNSRFRENTIQDKSQFGLLGKISVGFARGDWVVEPYLDVGVVKTEEAIELNGHTLNDQFVFYGLGLRWMVSRMGR